MFKRLAVLIVFVFGVGWWFTHRAEDSVEKSLTKVSQNSEIEKTEAAVENLIEDLVEDLEETSDKIVDNQEGEKNDTQEDENLEAGVFLSVEADVSAPVLNESTLVKSNYPVVVSSAPVQSQIKKYIAPVVSTVLPVVTPVQVDSVGLVSDEVMDEVEASKEFIDRDVFVKAYLYEWGLDFSHKTIEAGSVTFSVLNNGRFIHEINIAGHGKLSEVEPGSKNTFTVYLEPGQYEVFSSRRNDYERGMKDMITVVE